MTDQTQAPMSARDYAPERMTEGSWIAQAKPKGWRGLFKFGDANAGTFNESGERYILLDSVLPHFYEVVRCASLPAGIIDGVIVSRGVDQPEYDSVFYAFDVISVAAWNGDDQEPLSSRLEALSAIQRHLAPHALVKVLSPLTVDTPQRADEVFAKCVARGFDGVVYKRLDSPYERGPSWNWLKRTTT